MIDEGLRHGPDNPLGDQGRTGNLQEWAARHKLGERYLIFADDVKRAYSFTFFPFRQIIQERNVL
jgi:hypothetical protein